MSFHTSLWTQLDELKAATQVAASLMGPDNVALVGYANVLKWIVSKDTDEGSCAAFRSTQHTGKYNQV